MALDITLKDSNVLQPLPQSVLNIEDKIRSNPFTWRGQFSPQLIEALLNSYAPENAFVLDPFVGSGTVLLEAGKLNMRAFGAELNPAAAKLAQTYQLMNMPKAQREPVLRELDRLLTRSFAPNTLSHGAKGQDHSYGSVKETLVRLHSGLDGGAIKGILETLIVTCDFYNADTTALRAFSVWNELKRIIRCLPFTTNPIHVRICDARSLPLDEGSIDLVVTSPPYINVFNYHQQYRASVEAIGWDILSVAQSEIGSNRKYRRNRFLTVIQYCIDIASVLAELRRVCKQYAQVIFVVGKESQVRKTRFFNGDILSDVASRCVGLKIALKQQRYFKNKFGQIIYEDIYHFSVDDKFPAQIESPLVVARNVLKDAESRAPDESLSDLYSALNELDTITASPIFSPHDCIQR